MYDKNRKYLQTFVAKHKNPAQAAKAWGIHPNTLREIMNGRRGIGRDVYFQLLNVIDGVDAVKLANIRARGKV